MSMLPLDINPSEPLSDEQKNILNRALECVYRRRSEEQDPLIGAAIEKRILGKLGLKTALTADQLSILEIIYLRRRQEHEPKIGAAIEERILRTLGT